MTKPDIPALAERLHAGQTDKAGAPYITHLARVAGILKRRWPDASDDEIAAAWLHDSLEDTEATEGSLLTQASPRRPSASSAPSPGLRAATISTGSAPSPPPAMSRSSA